MQSSNISDCACGDYRKLILRYWPEGNKKLEWIKRGQDGLSLSINIAVYPRPANHERTYNVTEAVLYDTEGRIHKYYHFNQLLERGHLGNPVLDLDGNDVCYMNEEIAHIPQKNIHDHHLEVIDHKIDYTDKPMINNYHQAGKVLGLTALAHQELEVFTDDVEAAVELEKLKKRPVLFV